MRERERDLTPKTRINVHGFIKYMRFEWGKEGKERRREKGRDEEE